MDLFLIYSCAGIIQGVVFCVLFFRMDSSWKRFVSFSSSSGGIVGTFIGLNKLLVLENSNINYVFAIITVSFLLSAIICFYLLCILLKKQSGTNVIRTLDIIVAHDKFFKNYYTTRQKEIDSLLSFDKLSEIRTELVNKEKQLTEKEKIYFEKETLLNIAIQDVPHMDLPAKNKIPFDNSFIEVLPSYIDSLATFINDINCLTNDFLLKYESNKVSEYNFLMGYFLGICTYVSKSLFDSNSNNVRTHIRVLLNDKYEKLIASLGGKEFKDQLTSIPINKGMIYESFKLKSSLIKSLNVEHHIDARNDSVWQDYITFSLFNTPSNGDAFLSMGISVKNREKHKKFLYFLNYYKIENVMQDNVNKINSKCNIIEVISNKINNGEKEAI